MTDWKKTKFVGVRVKESPTRKHKGKPDRYYLIRYGRDGKIVQEGIGWASEGATPQFSSNLRAEILSNIRLGSGHQSLREKRQREEAKRQAKKNRGITLQQSFEDFLKVRTLKPRTKKDYQRSMDVAFPDWKLKGLLDISRDMVSARHFKLKESMGPAQANQHFRFLRALLNFSIGSYDDPENEGPLIKSNPVDRLSQTKQWCVVERRTTEIKKKDFPKWFKAVLNLNNQMAKNYLLILLFCGLRKGEGLRLEKSHVDIEDRVFTIMDPKNKKPLKLPIPRYIFHFLKERIKSDDGSKFIFPGPGKSGHYAEPKRSVQSVIKESKVDFCLHDLRRFFVTRAEELDISGYSIKMLVNHSLKKDGDVTAGYLTPDPERLRKPMAQIEQKILQIAGAQGKGKIVKLKTGS